MATATIRRQVRRAWENGDFVGFTTKSFSKDDGTRYHPTICTTTGEFHCDCPDATFRKRLCKHVTQAGLGLIRKRELRPDWLSRVGLTCCLECGQTQSEAALFGLAHNDGTPAYDVWICADCIARKQAEQKEKNN